MTRLQYIPLLILLLLSAAPPAVKAEDDPCKEQGIIVRNASTINLWYKKDKGNCALWTQQKLFTIKPKESADIFRDMTCQTSYCTKSLAYEDCSSFDTDRNCRVRILPNCTLSDM